MCVRSHIHISCDSFCFQIQSIIFLVGVCGFFFFCCLWLDISHVRLFGVELYIFLLLLFYVAAAIHCCCHLSHSIVLERVPCACFFPKLLYFYIVSAIRHTVFLFPQFQIGFGILLLRCCTAYNIFFIVLTFFELH